jgi:hypothetical protein
MICPLSSSFRHSLGQDVMIRLRYSRKAGLSFTPKSAVADLGI